MFAIRRRGSMFSSCDAFMKSSKACRLFRSGLGCAPASFALMTLFHSSKDIGANWLGLPGAATPDSPVHWEEANPVALWPRGFVNGPIFAPLLPLVGFANGELYG